MTLGVMQPYFFPHLGYFALITAVQEWVVFDITQYTPKSWVNRNRVLHPDRGWQYISIPLRRSSIHMRISEAKIADFRRQEQYVLGKISHYKKRAPYYAETCEIVRRSFADVTNDSLVSLNAAALRTVCEYLGLPFSHRLCSQLDITLPEKLLPGKWAPAICAKLSANVYVNSAGGRELFDPSDFAKEGVSLRFLEFKPFVYGTPGYVFENSLSILDVLMWNRPDEIIEAIRKNSALISA